MTYKRLNIEEFGRQLIETGDLDPVYIILHKTQLPYDELCRWLVAYWCTYDCGVASILSEAESDEHFWELLHKAAINEDGPVDGRWPRAKERRHWRGEASVRSAKYLIGRYTSPQDMIEYVSCTDPQYEPKHAHVGQVMTRVREHYLFGDWIGFKVADMLDALSLRSVIFDQPSVFMFNTPYQAAILLYNEHLLNTGQRGFHVRIRDEKRVVNAATGWMMTKMRKYMAPPKYDRWCRLQEIETVLCKWKSHMSGHYPVGNDLIEIGHSLDRIDSKTARALRENLPCITE